MAFLFRREMKDRGWGGYRVFAWVPLIVVFAPRDRLLVVAGGGGGGVYPRACSYCSRIPSATKRALPP